MPEEAEGKTYKKAIIVGGKGPNNYVIGKDLLQFSTEEKIPNNLTETPVNATFDKNGKVTGIQPARKPDAWVPKEVSDKPVDKLVEENEESSEEDAEEYPRKKKSK